MKTKLALAIAAAALSTCAFADNNTTAPANKPFYVSVSGGLAHNTKPTDSIYNSDHPLKTGFNLSASAGYTFNATQTGDIRVEAQYIHTSNDFSDKLKSYYKQIINQFPLKNATVESKLSGNYVMANGIYDFKMNPQITVNAGLGFGFAHLSKAIDNADLTKYSQDTQDILGSENTYALGLILGAQYNITPEVALGANYEALMTSTPRAGKVLTVTSGDLNVSNQFLVNNLVNVNLTYKLPM